MLQKTPKPGIWKFIKGSAKVIFVFEAVSFAVCYGVYHRMNTNRDFRQYINENCPYILDYYYKLGETLGDSDLRKIDATVWKAQQEKSTTSN